MATKLGNRRARLKEKRTKTRKQKMKQMNRKRQHKLQTLAPNAKKELMTEERKNDLRGGLEGTGALGRELVAGTTVAAAGASVVAVATGPEAGAAVAAADAGATRTLAANAAGAGIGTAMITRPAARQVRKIRRIDAGVGTGTATIPRLATRQLTNAMGGPVFHELDLPELMRQRTGSRLHRRPMNMMPSNRQRTTRCI